ncbi:MAG: hypothetical protein IPK53_09320 [bacterium]|nr:hypothetical protein [bacterium]
MLVLQVIKVRLTKPPVVSVKVRAGLAFVEPNPAVVWAAETRIPHHYLVRCPVKDAAGAVPDMRWIAVADDTPVTTTALSQTRGADAAVAADAAAERSAVVSAGRQMKPAFFFKQAQIK